MILTPYVLGSGRAADALKKSLILFGIQNPQLKIQPFTALKRGETFPLVSSVENPILIIANPHGLHAQAILDGEKAGFKAILTEKPSCVNLDQLQSLKKVKIPVAVTHGYRQMWGIQTMKQMLDNDAFGEIITIEGRYWQSSTAQRALAPDVKNESWKNDPTLSGDFDTLIDIGTHWVDAVSYLMNETAFGGTTWLSYANSEAEHRDSHAHVALQFSNGRRALGSISKTVHGATNHFELNLIGTKGSATWQFLNPDELLIGKGNTRSTLARKETILGSQQPPFHGLGWLEGYIEVIRQLVLELQGNGDGNYPKLSQNLQILESLFKTVS
jgi:predicted dehydrogenase